MLCFVASVSAESVAIAEPIQQGGSACIQYAHGLIHSKKGIVILTSGLLYEFQTSAQQRAKLVCVSGVHQECGKHISAVSKLTSTNHLYS